MSVLEPVLTSQLLVIDDLGASKPTLWALETVGHILNTRYNKKLVTLVTTNFMDSETSQRAKTVLPSGTAVPRLEDTLADRVGQRIRSRLYEMCKTVEMIAPDFRQRTMRASHLRT